MKPGLIGCTLVPGDLPVPEMVAIKQFVGNGLYTVAEAALYARVSTAMMGRWLFGSGDAQAVIDPQFGRADRLVSFLDLIQSLAIREIRLQRKVPLPKFRQAISVARKALGLEYPFARRHCTYLLGEELVIRPSPQSEEFIEASGKHTGQRLFSFVEMYLESLTFDSSGLANKYQIFESAHSEPVKVLMDPEVRFGEPLLPSGYTAMTIWQAIATEGGIDRAARAYGIPKSEVETAYQFIDHLGKSAS